ncbi:HNH endonuclease signature motif containing protein [Bacillus toyonensis]|uniref:HNH endonuclease signature motif containing protein n=1 Tax=Bacillus toyonensis TaxID=155322 RepID=UPI00301913B4
MEFGEERSIKADIKRAIRKEAFFGCAICGNPIIEYHHIEPFSKVKCHETDNLIALCPTHHYKADRGMVPKDQLLQLKQNPYNKSKEIIKDDFFLGNYDVLEFRAGSNTFIRTPDLFVIDNFPLISVYKDEFNNAVINAKFFDKSSILIAEIVDNEWITYLGEDMVWDIQYSGGRLKVNSDKGKVFLEFYSNPEHNYVELKANLYYKGHFFDIKPSKVTVGVEQPKSPIEMMISGNTTVDCQIGMYISSSNL